MGKGDVWGKVTSTFSTLLWPRLREETGSGLAYCLPARNSRRALDPINPPILRLKLLIMQPVPKIHFRLEIQPQLGGSAKGPREPDGGIWSNPTPPVADLADATAGEAQAGGQLALGQPQGLHEFLDQDLPRPEGAAFGDVQKEKVTPTFSTPYRPTSIRFTRWFAFVPFSQ